MTRKSHYESRRAGRSVAPQPRAADPAVPAMTPELLSVLGRAVAWHQAGRFGEAEPLYREVLRAQPRHFDSRHLLGVILCQRGEFDAAVGQIEAALTINPGVAAAHNNLGNALRALGRAEEAVASYGRAIALKADYADAFYNRAAVLQEFRRYEEAVEDYGRAIALRPGQAEAFNNRGNAFKGLARFAEALADYDRAIALRADYAEAWYNRGNALYELKRFEEALASSERAVALNPDLPEAFNNRGNALKELRRFEDAVDSYRRALALRPDYAGALANLGNALKDLRRFDEALAHYDRAIALDPDNPDVPFNRGIALVELQRLEDALASYDQAIALKPDHAEALFNRGSALLALKRFDEAAESYGRAVAIKPDLTNLKGVYLHSRMHICDWTNFETDNNELVAAVASGRDAVFPFQLLACRSAPGVQLACARTFVANKCPAHPQPLWRGERYAHDRIRVAYLSADLYDHPVACLSAGLFSRHDHARFDTIAISFGRHEPSPMRDRLQRSFERFIDADAISDREVAELLRGLEVDIAVDLNGFTDNARPDILARRPAPVQVNYLGYAGTLGQDYCDYIVADRFVIPEESRRHYAEQVAYLPDSFLVNDCDRPISPRTPSRAEAGLPEAALVFCCFNNSFKITPDIFAVWMHILQEIDGSVLWLSSANATAVANLRREAVRSGIDGARLIFAPRVPSNENHLARLRLADLFVDTLYYNAHATAADALWAGVPVLTCAGTTFASRVAGSLLHAVGLPELVTTSLADYQALALALARDPVRLASLRQRLSANRNVEPLFDTERFTRNLESAYTTMWERTQRSERPESFAVTAPTR